MSRDKFAFFLAHNRQELLDEAVSHISPQVDFVLVFDNASDPVLKVPPTLAQLVLIQVPDQPPNIAKMWNLAFDIFHSMSHSWDAAMLCDDSMVPAGWFQAVTVAMRETGATIGCSSPWSQGYAGGQIFKTQPDHDIANRMPGWAWIVDGDRGLMADERLHWWWCDTDMDFRARKDGGMVIVDGFPVKNVHPGQYTAEKPELGAQAGADGAMFEQIWGFRPW